MKKCPYCAEKILDAAVYCRYCHKDLVPNASHRVLSNDSIPTNASEVFYPPEKRANMIGAFVPLIIFTIITALGSIMEISSTGIDSIQYLFFPILFTICIVGLYLRKPWALCLTAIASIFAFFGLVLIPFWLWLISTLNKAETKKEFLIPDKKKNPEGSANMTKAWFTAIGILATIFLITVNVGKLF